MARLVSRGAAAAVAALTLGACTSAAQGPTPSPTVTTSTTSPTASPGVDAGGGTLRFALGADPASIDPRFVRDEEGSFVVDALFDSLVSVGPDLTTVEPAAATRWEVSDDGLVYTFHLRADGAFHDGTPVTAADFVRAFHRIVDQTVEPKSFLYYQLAPIAGFEQTRSNGDPLAGVEAVDDHTLRITLQYPFADFLYVLAEPSLAPIPASASDDPGAFANEPIGNGPFQMAAPWQHNQFIRVVRSETSSVPARLDEVVFQIYADDGQREQQYADFGNGLVDVAEIPPADLDEARTEYGQSRDGYTGPGVLDGVTGTVYYYGFNTTQPPFDDPAVRRALSMLIDRRRIVGDITLGTRVVADSIVPPPIPGADVGACDYCVYQPEAAKAALTDEDGVVLPGLEGPLRILYNTGTTNERIADLVAGDIRTALGIEVQVESADLEPFVQQVRSQDVQIFRLGWQAEYPSPGSVLAPLFSTATQGTDNLSWYSNAEVDALLEQAHQERDHDARMALYRQAEGLVLADAPVAPIFFYRQTRVVSDVVANLRIGPLGSIGWSQVELTRAR